MAEKRSQECDDFGTNLRLGRRTGTSRPRESAGEAEDDLESPVDLVQLFPGHASDWLAEPPVIDGPDLLGEHARAFARDLDLGPE